MTPNTNKPDEMSDQEKFTDAELIQQCETRISELQNAGSFTIRDLSTLLKRFKHLHAKTEECERLRKAMRGMQTPPNKKVPYHEIIKIVKKSARATQTLTSGEVILKDVSLSALKHELCELMYE